MENINPNEPDVSHNKSIALDLPLLSRNQVSQNDDKSSVSSKRRPSGFEVAGERTLKVRPSNKEVLNTVSIKTEAPNTLATKSSSILASLKEVMTAPLYAMVAAVIVALFPFLRVINLTYINLMLMDPLLILECIYRRIKFFQNCGY